MSQNKVGITLTASDETKKAFDSVNKSLSDLSTKSAQSGQATAAALGGMSGSTKYAIQNASYQISDFVVQVQGGTAASRALGQQLPQLLAGFGALGAVAGIVASFAPQIVEFFKSGDEVKPFSASLSDLDGALVGIAETSRQFDMTPVFKQFNASNQAAREGQVSLLEYRKALADVTAQAAEVSIGSQLKEMASFGTLDKIIGGDKAVDVAKKLGIELGVARDLLADARSGVSESTILAERYAIALARGSKSGRELAATLVAAAKGSSDAAAAQTAISDALAKMTKAGATGMIPIDDKKSKASKGPADKASDEALAYGKAMEQLAGISRDADAAQLDLTRTQKTLYDLMVAPEWANMPEAWRQTAAAQFDQAYAAEQAARAMAEGKKLVESMRTPHEVLADDIDRLNKLLDGGAINWETYSRAIFSAQDAFDKTQAKAKETAGEMDHFFQSAAKNIQSSMADFLFDPFKDGLDGMASRFGTMIQRMIADAAAAQLAKNLFGTMGQATAGGGGGDWGWVGKAATWAASLFADGGVMTSQGAVPLRKYAGGGIASSPQLAMFGEGAQPEAYVPLPDGRRIPVSMQGGQGMVINQTINAGQGTDSAQVRRSAAAGARAALGAMNGAQRYA